MVAEVGTGGINTTAHDSAYGVGVEQPANVMPGAELDVTGEVIYFYQRKYEDQVAEYRKVSLDERYEQSTRNDAHHLMTHYQLFLVDLGWVRKLHEEQQRRLRMESTQQPQRSQVRG